MLTAKQQKRCDRYRRMDENGFVHCNECPLVVGYQICRAIAHYDRHKRESVTNRFTSAEEVIRANLQSCI